MLKYYTSLSVLAATMAASAADFTDSQFYLDYGGPSGDPYAMTRVGQKLYVGGGFLDVQGRPDLKNLARFNLYTEAWEQIPGIDSNHNNFVRSLHKANDGTILVGGDFTSIGGVAAQKIARFDPRTNNWSQLLDPSAGDEATGPLGGGVQSITSFGDRVYIGADILFNTDNLSWKFIRQFNTATDKWSPIGEGLDATVHALVADGAGNIYAGGGFTMSGGTEVKALAMWNGNAWSQVGGGVEGFVRAIAIAPDGRLFVGGQFTSVGGQAVSNVAAWDGSTWDTLNGGIKGSDSVNGVYGMSIDASGRVYISGEFDSTADESSLGNVAVWDGSGQWRPLGSGLGTPGSSQIVNSVYAFGNDAYFGGVFADPNGSPNRKKNFARWNSEMDFTDYLPGMAGLESSFTIERVAGEAKVAFDSFRGISYVLQSSDSSLGNWRTISSSINGDGRRWMFTVPITPAADFFRILASQ